LTNLNFVPTMIDTTPVFDMSVVWPLHPIYTSASFRQVVAARKICKNSLQ
jgi:hypothetical protein